MRKVSLILCLPLLSLLFNSCKNYDNFTTFFNTYYNANKLIKISEDEFEYQDELKKTQPRVFIPDMNLNISIPSHSGIPPFMNEFIIEGQKLQPVKIKLDSVIIKGSKILSKHPNSDYIEKTLYLMALAYFYRNEWLPAQIKCNELVDKYFDGDMSPDAHLLLAKAYLIQRKFSSGTITLSRTIDISWQKQRYDILSEAFRLSAELALYQNDLEKALKPYKQAISQSDNNELKAKWQIDLAALLYKKGKFYEAYHAFKKVLEFSPTYLEEFESKLYQALCLMRLDKHEDANNILDKLEGNNNFSDWKPFIHSARMDLARIKNDSLEYDKLERYNDSAYINNPSSLAVYFQKAADYYKNNEYTKARKYFAKTRNTKSSVYHQSERMFYFLNTWEAKRNDAKPYLERLRTGNLNNDTSKLLLSMSLFDLGRIHEQLNHLDSAKMYYKMSAENAPDNDTLSARFIYAYARVNSENNQQLSDSLLEVIVDKYPRTEFGKDAMLKLGYTEKFLIDTVADLYFSGNSLRSNKEFNFAINQYRKVYLEYPESKFAPKALYAIGMIYENNFRNRDSALFYYDTLIKKYPKSEQALELKLPVAYLTALKKGGNLPDSLKDRPKVTFTPSIDPYQETLILQAKKSEWEANKKKREEELNMENIINNPSLLFKKGKELLDDPSKIVPKIESPIDFKDIKNKLNVDSLNLKKYIEPFKKDTTKTEPVKPK